MKTQPDANTFALMRAVNAAQLAGFTGLADSLFALLKQTAKKP